MLGARGNVLRPMKNNLNLISLFLSTIKYVMHAAQKMICFHPLLWVLSPHQANIGGAQAPQPPPSYAYVNER